MRRPLTELCMGTRGLPGECSKRQATFPGALTDSPTECEGDLIEINSTYDLRKMHMNAKFC